MFEFLVRTINEGTALSPYIGSFTTISCGIQFGLQFGLRLVLGIVSKVCYQVVGPCICVYHRHCERRSKESCREDEERGNFDYCEGVLMCSSTN